MNTSDDKPICDHCGECFRNVRNYSGKLLCERCHSDLATLASQVSPRSDAGIGADLFALGCSFSRLYKAEVENSALSR